MKRNKDEERREKQLRGLGETIIKRNDSRTGRTYRQGVADAVAYLLAGGCINDFEVLIQFSELPERLEKTA